MNPVRDVQGEYMKRNNYNQVEELNISLHNKRMRLLPACAGRSASCL